MTFDLFTNLKEAFNASTHNNNLFADLIGRIRWDDTFFADGEHYFVKGNMTFTTPSLNPFEITKNWMPSAIFSDGSYIEF